MGKNPLDSVATLKGKQSNMACRRRSHRFHVSQSLSYLATGSSTTVGCVTTASVASGLRGCASRPGGVIPLHQTPHAIHSHTPIVKHPLSHPQVHAGINTLRFPIPKCMLVYTSHPSACWYTHPTQVHAGINTPHPLPKCILGCTPPGEQNDRQTCVHYLQVCRRW